MSEFEKILIGALDVNDGVDYTLEELSFKPAEAKPQWAENADADGAALVQEPHYTNAYFEMQIRVEPRSSTDEALTAVGALLDAVQECARIEGGQEIPWTPNNSGRTYTWYALMGEVVEIPITVSGDMAGWFIESPVVKVKLTCRPFGYGEERTVLEATTSTAPLQVVYIGEIEGDIAAEATLRVTDKALQGRRYLEWGLDLVAAEAGNPALELEAGKGLSVEGFGGTLTWRTGSRSPEAAQIKLGKNPVAICSTGEVEQAGSFRLLLRCQAPKGALFRASYRVGDGPWVGLPWVPGGGQASSVTEEWRSIDLGEAFFEEVEKGEQVSETRLEGKMEEGLLPRTAYLDLLDQLPTRRYGRARGPAELGTPSVFMVSDGYDQGEMNATGKEAEIGGPYVEVAKSDATDFVISGSKLKRTAVSDSGAIGTRPFAGRAIGTALKFTDVALSFDYDVEAELGENASRWGAVVAYVDNTHFVMINLFRDAAGGVVVAAQAPNGFALGTSDYLNVFTGHTSDTVVRCQGTLLFATHGNRLIVYSESDYEPLQPVLRVDSNFIGAKGVAALYDQRSSSSPAIREYDNLAIWVPEVPLVCCPGRSVEVRDNSAEREDAAGAKWGPVPEYRGSHFLLDPAGGEGAVNRVAVRMRRDDLAEEAETNSIDAQSVEVSARERFLAPR